MALPDDEHTLAAIAQQLGGIFGERYGCDPGRVDAFALGDILLVAMRDGDLTTLERTLVDIGRPDRVLELRRDFQQTIAGRYHREVTQLTGHRVLRSLSQAHVEPVLMIEIFLMGATLDREFGPPD
jgi:uncharacterized protein YbcI